MRNTALLSTAAAVLLLGAGVASAQKAKDEARPERAPAAQQNAPAEKTAPSMNAGERKAPETTGQGASESSKEPSKSESKSGSDMQKSGTTGTSPKSEMEKSGSDKSEMKSDKSEMKKSDTNKSDKSEMRKSGDEKSGKSEMKSEDRSKNATSNEKSSSGTTGQGAAAGSAKLSTEQRTKITTIINKKQVTKVEPSKLNISVRVGARVPASVHFYPLPVEVVEVYPEWRGYDYILLASGDILVLMPRTHEIVAIISA